MVVLGMVLSSLMLCLLAQGTESAIDSAPQRAAGAYPKKGLFFWGGGSDGLSSWVAGTAHRPLHPFDRRQEPRMVMGGERLKTVHSHDRSPFGLLFVTAGLMGHLKHT